MGASEKEKVRRHFLIVVVNLRLFKLFFKPGNHALVEALRINRGLRGEASRQAGDGDDCGEKALHEWIAPNLRHVASSGSFRLRLVLPEPWVSAGFLIAGQYTVRRIGWGRLFLVGARCTKGVRRGGRPCGFYGLGDQQVPL